MSYIREKVVVFCRSEKEDTKRDAITLVMTIGAFVDSGDENLYGCQDIFTIVTNIAF